MFALEALKARHGDCLLLHWGDASLPRVGLIDGGPDRTYREALAPRLTAIADARGLDRVTLDLTMVSHIDDDHINGLLELADAIEDGSAPAKIGLLWHNSLEGLLDGRALGTAETTSVLASFAAGGPFDICNPDLQQVLASVPQGQLLHAFAKREKIDHCMNAPFKDLVVAGRDAVKIKGLEITVLSPEIKEIEALREKWVENRRDTITAAYADRSPYNLSSIVVLAAFGGKRMLLTGDGRGDLILKGLARHMTAANGRFHVDLLKVPHHGSCNNVTAEFFKKVTADSYVVSGDQKMFPNPNMTAMGWLAAARGDESYEVYCTYQLSEMRALFGSRLHVPDAGALSVTAHLSA